MRLSKQVLAFCLGGLAALSGCDKVSREPASPLPAPADTAWASLHVELYHGSGDTAFVLGEVFVRQDAALSVTSARYYLSNPALIDSAGKHIPLGAWYKLISLANPAGWAFALPRVPAGRYDSLELMLGVDSTASLSLDHSGELSVDSGMFWAWSTGYIHTRVEGSLGRGGPFGWHVGGSKAPTANQRILRLPLSIGNLLALPDSAQAHLRVQVNLFHLFDGPILPATTRFVENAGAGRAIADQWPGIFSVDTAWVE